MSCEYIETYTGRKANILAPTPEMFSIIDIAHALSSQCRYSGHTKYHYSVAQHCSLLAKWLEAHGGTALDCLQVLMHDAPEAYLVDIPRPIKQHMPEYRVWEAGIDKAIREWMGWSNFVVPEIQEKLDNRIIIDERVQLMSVSGNDWGTGDLKPLGVLIYPVSPKFAKEQFLRLYAKYSLAICGAPMYHRDQPIHVTGSQGNSLTVMELDVRGGVARQVRSHSSPWIHDKFKVGDGDEH